jgi:hypothetical protein
MHTLNCEHMTANDFNLWVLQAEPGETVVYAKGHLGEATGNGADGGEARALQRQTWWAAENGLTTLVQRRIKLGDGMTMTEYLAKRKALEQLR